MIVLNFGFQQAIYAQCATPINSFPYNEDFETSDGNWITGGTASDWVWGQPAKAVITGAGGGSKCWIVGGTSGTTYNGGEKSWLQSPCFDISSLSYPEISFKVFWEMERRYDGAAIEYTIDGGISWNLLGSINSNADCSGQNWFNYNPINFLGSAGWSGNIQSTSGSCQGGGGSGAWLTARHTLSGMAGATAIMFRFTFAAGTTCNSFDGFAVDDLEIGNAAPNAADFTYTCTSSSAADFTSSSVGCKTSVSWDFNDTGSGAGNSSSLDNPSHTFSGLGDYTVTLTTNFASGPSLVIAKGIRIIAVSGSITSPVKCNGDQTGAILASVNPPGSYNYAWDTSPAQNTAAITNLLAGTYNVIVTATNTCSGKSQVILPQPEKLDLKTIISDAKCGSNNGSITADVSGGTIPYSYNWSNSAATQSITALPAGNYSLSLKDGNGCQATAANLTVNAVVTPIAVNIGKDTSICPGEKLVLNPGNYVSYKWQDNTSAATYTVTSSGIYTVTVTDVFGCTGTGRIKVTVDCSEIYFPSAFTPNDDVTNDKFGPFPDNALASLSDYKLTVYSRWGQVIFSSTDPFKKWDGTFKGDKLTSQTFTWMANYKQRNHAPVFKKGTVTIIR
jgi:gliding motility-associated-like protein